MKHKILVINTGSTSTKVALFEDTKKIFSAEITHDPEELALQAAVDDQIAFRKQTIAAALSGKADLIGLSAVAARGGTFGRVKGGAYLVDESLLEACRNPITAHASNLSALIGQEIATEYGCRAYIYDAVCTDEVQAMARVTGLKGVERRVFSHTLNTRAAARAQAEKMGRPYEELNFIVAHLGGGISVNVHQKGRIIDLVADDDGAMSPERCGRINALTVAKLCFSGKYDAAQMTKKLKGGSGLWDHLGVTDLRIVEKMIERGDKNAAFILDVFGYQLSKDIASLAAVLEGNVDCIILTGGCAHSKRLTEHISRRVSFIAPVAVMAGTWEMEALAKGVIRVLDGKEEAKKYIP